MITTDFLVATAAQAAMNHAIVPSSVPPSHAVIAKAEEGDAAAIQAVLNHCKLARAEEDAADDVVRQLEKEAGHRLDAFSTIKVKEAFKMTLASRRISLTEITSPVFGKTTIVEPPRDPFRVVIIWRHSDDDSQKDFSESGLSLLEATWSLFAEDSKFRHASPTTGYLEVVSTFRIGSAIAGLTVKNGKEEHVLWEDLANDLRGAHRLIILGDDGFVTDRPSLAYLFSKTTADVVFGYTDTEASRAAYEIYTVEELLTSLQEHSSPVGRWWRSLNEGAAKRYLLSAAHNTRTLPQRHKFVEMAAESGWLAASGSQVKPSVNLPGIGQGRALTLKNRRKQLTFDVSKVLAAPPKSQEPRPRKRQKKAKHADKHKRRKLKAKVKSKMRVVSIMWHDIK
ncbi:unnamed protein product [Sympodiomycopsis kandeliae]